MALIMNSFDSAGDTYTFYEDARFTGTSAPISCAVNDIIAIVGISGLISNVTGGDIIGSIRTTGGSQHLVLVKATTTSVNCDAAGSYVIGIIGKVE